MLDTEEVAVTEDVVVDHVVAPQLAAIEPRLGADPVELSPLQEGRVLGRLQELPGGHLRPDRGAGGDLHDVRPDPLPPEAPGHRDTVVAVLHEVDIAQLVNVDGSD